MTGAGLEAQPAIDLAGNTSTLSLPLLVDTVGPVVSFTAPAANQKFNASQLAGNPNVISNWTVTDGDPQAATTRVNGTASTTTTIAVPTTANDNPATYTTTVTASDRAGNIGSASVTYTVDRKAPTIATWTPAAMARNVDPLQSVITFSEPVAGPLPTSPALIVRSQTAPTGDVWDSSHVRYTLPLDTFAGSVLDVGVVPGLTDDYGNPLATVADKKFHLVTVVNSGLLLPNVNTFAASSDRDGIITIATIDTSNVLRIAQINGTNFGSYAIGAVGTRVAVNSWSGFDPVTLRSLAQLGVSNSNSSSWRYIQFTPATGFSVLTPTTVGAVISQPPYARETTTAPTGLVLGSTYTRGALTVTLPTQGDMWVAQSDDSWAVVTVVGSSLRWSRYRCNRDTQLFPGPATYTCGGTEYATTFGSSPAPIISATMTRSGNCLHIATQYGGSIFQPLANCDGALGVSPPASCNSNTSFPPAGPVVKSAPFTGNGEDTLLFSSLTTTANQFGLAKMTPGICGISSLQSCSRFRTSVSSRPFKRGTSRASST